jgi:hypothetical protein
MLVTRYNYVHLCGENDSYGKKLLDKNMMECQGPALWAYNNKKFTSEDLVNITKVSGATKEADTSLQVKFLLMMARQVLQQCPVIYLDV